MTRIFRLVSSYITLPCLALLAAITTPIASLHADDWSFVVAPYLLAPSISGDASLGRIDSADVDISSSDIFRSLDLGAMLQLEARHSSGYGALINYAFMDLGNRLSGPRGQTELNTDIFQGILEGFITRRVDYQGGTFDLYGGVRWWDIGLDANLNTNFGSASFSRDKDWVDPVVGVRWMPRLSESFRLLLQGDVGGFGVASDFTWCAQAGGVLDLSSSTSVVLLYKALGVDYHSGNRGTASFFEYDTITQGPLLGVVFRF